MPKSSFANGLMPSLMVLSAALFPAWAAAGPFNDQLVFGDKASELQHDLVADHSDLVSGVMGKRARRLNPVGNGDWRGGHVDFSLKVDPHSPNYVTLRQWGDDETDDRMTLFCDGKQIGYRQIGDVEPIDQGTHAKMAPGRFLTTTLPLPMTLTEGKASLRCSIEATGPFWWYGANFAQYQKPMTAPARPMYALYSTTDPFFPEQPDNGHAPLAKARPDDQSAVLGQVKMRINSEIQHLWASDKSPNQLEVNFLARAYALKWSSGYQSSQSLGRIVAGLDAIYATYKSNPDFVLHDHATPNADWFGIGLCGQALKIVAPHIQKELDETIGWDGAKPIRRRDAYAEMFRYSRDGNIHTRRLYSNQSMIKDLYGIWYDNEGLIALQSPLAKSRDELLPFFYESVGLQEWTGSHTDDGQPTYATSESDDKATMPKGYFEVTPMGLTKELGYVGGYGEILDLVDSIYEATRAGDGSDGDPKIRAQLTKMALARSHFRYPQYDADGYKTMRLEGVVGWRDHYYPQDSMYLQRTSFDSSAIHAAIDTQDPRLIGYAQQMLDDNQFFLSVATAMKTGGVHQSLGLLDTIDDYIQLAALPKASSVLPMSASAPDSVFADPQDGVVSVKNGADVFYASLYWRANYGINHLAKVHLVSPTTDRVATVYEREEFTPSGQTFIRPNNPHINGNRFTVKYPGDDAITQAQAGEPLPIAKAPEGARYDWGQDNPYAGRADYYELRYGPYLVAMNASADKTFSVQLPTRSAPVRELSAGQSIAPDVQAIAVAPGKTVVIYLGAEQ